MISIPIHPPNLAWNFTRVNGGGGRGTKANSRLLSSTGEQRVDQRIAEHEPDGGQPRVLDSSRPHSSIGTTPFPRRDFNYHLSVHVAQDQGRQGAREGGNRDVGREQSTTGAGTAQIRFNDRCPTCFDLDLLFISDLTIVQSRYLATFACLTRNESQTKASRDHFATDRCLSNHARIKRGAWWKRIKERRISRGNYFRIWIVIILRMIFVIFMRVFLPLRLSDKIKYMHMCTIYIRIYILCTN